MFALLLETVARSHRDKVDRTILQLLLHMSSYFTDRIFSIFQIHAVIHICHDIVVFSNVHIIVKMFFLKVSLLQITNEAASPHGFF